MTLAMREEWEGTFPISGSHKHGGGYIENDFWYLAGPMSNLPGFNFERFQEVAKTLREQGYNIVNPAEFDHEVERAAKAETNGSHKELTKILSEHGVYNPTWAECLKRDIEYVGHDNCLGIICLEGWEQSQGAQFETYVAYKLLKPIYRYYDGLILEEINRREALTLAGVED